MLVPKKSRIPTLTEWLVLSSAANRGENCNPTVVYDRHRSLEMMMRRFSCTTIVALTAYRLGVISAVALFAVSSVVRGADTDPSISGFQDFNGDHRISHDEFVHNMAVKSMREMDTDKNGFLPPDEMTASAAKGEGNSPHINFSEADANGDGKVSLDELEQAIRAKTDVHVLFQKLDKDKDGFLNESELKEVHGVPLIIFRF
jgi:hypothetical protein